MTRRVLVRPVDLAVAALLTTALVFLLAETADTYFIYDDWHLLDAGADLRGIVEPYNDHLSVVILSAYRVLGELFGFAYLPYRVVGALSLLAVPALFFLTTRRVLGPPLAAVAAVATVSFGDHELVPAAMNHHLALAAGIVCAWALGRKGRRADVIVAAALAFAFASAGGGVAVAAGCVVHTIASRPARARWIAVLSPCLAWACWWLALALGNESQFRAEGEPVDSILEYAWRVVSSPFLHLGFGIPALAAVAGAAFVAVGAVRLRAGLDAAAPFLAWSAALVTWGVGLGYGRGASPLQPDAVFTRYRMVALGFALLALVPRRRIEWGTRWLFPVRARQRALAAAGVLVVACVVGGAMRDDLAAVAAGLEARALNSRSVALAVDAGPEVVPDDVQLGFTFVGLLAGDLRPILARYGGIPGDGPIDGRLVAAGGVVAATDPPAQPCRSTTAPLSFSPGGFRVVDVWGADARWRVDVRRFGTDWTQVAEGGPGEAVTLSLPAAAAEEPWEILVHDGCAAVREPGG